MRLSPEIIVYIATAACFGFGAYAVAWLIFAAFKYADTPDDRADQFPDGGRVASRPGSTRFAPGASFAVSAFGNDPSRGGTARALNQGD